MLSFQTLKTEKQGTRNNFVKYEMINTILFDKNFNRYSKKKKQKTK